ncbi:hypothetical protein DAPPUDRAFT_245911 [Daphnia pulex]|uniref:Uncharacterized protein n=1 Tax=Daphnia pulex TaxID=6669 RepID=E9GPA2_DAPPU|nr:hypothetical protein DAPPUDRAFT_245911 [Daphnia pulex]|eukprot:EFX78718.1 hypothetical protein DAPPUDRAFT_245911 [Daphnia pulex]
MDELASLLGPSEVCYICYKTTKQVAIGITAAKIQAPMLMHMQYRVKLPDHDWVVATGHKLIPSGKCVIHAIVCGACSSWSSRTEFIPGDCLCRMNEHEPTSCGQTKAEIQQVDRNAQLESK